MQVIDRGPSIGGMWGEAAGKGITGALQSFANYKIEDLQQKKALEYLKTVAPNEKTATLLSYLPRDMQQEAIKSMQTEKANRAIGQFLNIMAKKMQGQDLTGQQGYQKEDFAPSETAKSGAPSRAEASASERLSKLTPQQSATPESVTPETGRLPQVGVAKSPLDMFNSTTDIDFGPVSGQMQMHLANLMFKSQNEDRKAKEFKQKQEFAEKKLQLAERNVASKEKIAEGRLAQGAERVEIKQTQLKKDIQKDWSKWIEPSVQAAKEAKRNIKDYESIKKLAKSGNLRTPSGQKLAEFFGVEDLDRNLETQLFQKLTGRLAIAPSSAMGGKVTNYLDTVWQRRHATLMNTKEGIEAIADLNILDERMHEFEADAKKKFYDEHKGEVLPGDADAIIDQMLEPKREQVQDKMMKIMENAIAKTSGTYVAQVGEELDELPDPKLYPDGAWFYGVKDPSKIWEVRGSKFVLKNRGAEHA